MDSLDPAGEFLRLSEHYRRMSDSELLLLLPEAPSLTPLAQQALATEARQRGLKLEAEPSPPPPPEPPPVFDGADSTDPDDDSSSASPYDEDRELVEICVVWSPRDALQVQSLLDRAAIPFFMGPEKATAVDQVTSNFVNGVSVQVMRIGIPWAAPALSHYEPADEPPSDPGEELTDLTVHCPKCKSTEIILEDVIPDSSAVPENSARYKWICDSCGNRWEDGTAPEV